MKTNSRFILKTLPVIITALIVVGFLFIAMYWQHNRSNQLRTDLNHVVSQGVQDANKSPATEFTYSIEGQDAKLIVDGDNYALVFTHKPNKDDDITDFNIGTCRKLTNDFLDMKAVNLKKVAFTFNQSVMEYTYVAPISKPVVSSTDFYNSDEKANNERRMRDHFVSSLCKSMKYVGDEPATLTFHFAYTEL